MIKKDNSTGQGSNKILLENGDVRICFTKREKHVSKREERQRKKGHGPVIDKMCQERALNLERSKPSQNI